MTTYNSDDPTEIALGVYHLGVKDKVNAWANIPYLIWDGDEGVLIDPGSAKPEFFECVLRKVKKVCDPEQIKYMVVQHQDPDLCAALPLFEKLLHPQVKIYTPVESLLLVQHYGCSAPLVGVQDGEHLVFGKERQLTFVMTPYAHFIGSMVTYDNETKSLFTSDAFGGFSTTDSVYATEYYPDLLATFLGQHLGSKRALEYALKRIGQLIDGPGVSRFCPQHGCVINEEQIPTYMAAAGDLNVGLELTRLAIKNGIKLEWREENTSALVNQEEC
jgi:flavorubredoxin